MSKSQLLTCDVQDDRVLAAIGAVEREKFVPEKYAGCAYVDEDLPIASGRYLMEPVVFGHLLELAAVHPGDRVLDIGCGLGYSSAVLAQLAEKVYALESEAALAEEARARLTAAHISNVEVVTSALAAGLPAHRPYDVIVLEGAAQHISDKLLEQLAEGGRLVAVKQISRRPGEASGLGRMLKITRRENHFPTTEGRDASIPLLPGFEQRPGFEF